jgi:hypothetical protein
MSLYAIGLPCSENLEKYLHATGIELISNGKGSDTKITAYSGKEKVFEIPNFYTHGFLKKLIASGVQINCKLVKVNKAHPISERLLFQIEWPQTDSFEYFASDIYQPFENKLTVAV